MARPCTCDRFHETFQKGDCRLCWLYKYDERYRRKWDGETLTDKVQQFAADVKQWNDAGRPLVTTEELNARFQVCGNCNEYEPLLKRCLKCGCFLPAKARMKTSRCPLGKWGG